MATYYLSMVMGSSSGFFGFSDLIPVGPEPVQVEKADFNRDGHLDLAILSIGTVAAQAQEYGQSLHVLAGDGLGGFTTPFVIALSTNLRECRFAVGDLDGDLWADLALLESPEGRIRIALNARSSGTPEFRETVSPWAAGSVGSAVLVASGDFNGDGRDDLALGVTAPSGGEARLLLADEVGGARAGGSVSLPFSPTCMALARIDDDDALDLALGGAGSSPMGWACAIRGDGAGGLGPVAAREFLGVPADLAIGDLDKGAHEDLVYAMPERNGLDSLLVTSAGPPLPRFVRGDSNGDGGLDIVDAVAALIHLFLGATTDCQESLDANGDDSVDVADPVYILRFLFQGGPPPPAPFPGAGEDPGEDGLGCDRTT